jgi:hypothetical protein
MKLSADISRCIRRRMAAFAGLALLLAAVGIYNAYPVRRRVQPSDLQCVAVPFQQKGIAHQEGIAVKTQRPQGKG